MKFLLIFCTLLTLPSSWAKSAPIVGNKAAADYFSKRMSDPTVRARKERSFRSSSQSDHYLLLHIGGFIEDESYNWGGDGGSNVGSMSLGVSYRMMEWTNSTDFLLRIDFNSYEIGSERPRKMSILTMAAFPDVKSGFPIYFGFGAGGGVFLKQIKNESSISFDYQVFAGFRLFNVFEGMGIFVESGLKNHIHLLSDGQFNSTYLNTGTVFIF